MPNTIRLALVLHNHQPIGNFDGVFEQAYQDSYRRSWKSSAGTLR